MPRIGIPELILILVIVLVIFGAGKLPQIGGAIGKGIREFRKAQRDEDIGEAEPKQEAGAKATQTKK